MSWRLVVGPANRVAPAAGFRAKTSTPRLWRVRTRRGTAALVGAAIVLSATLASAAEPARRRTGKVGDKARAHARHAAPAEVPEEEGPPPIRVGVAGNPPFVMAGDGEPDGISVQIWRDAAARAGIAYTLVQQPGVGEMLSAVKAGALDVAVGPISITAARLQDVDFSQSYFEASTGILAPPAATSLAARARPFLSRAFIIGVMGLLAVLGMVGVLIWLAERRVQNEHFPKDFLRGVPEGMWFALVTMTTVGYGDRVPVTRMGRVVAGAWMVIAMLTASSLTAGIATALTLSQIDSPTVTNLASLRGKRIAVVADTSGKRLAQRYSPRLLEVPDLPQAVALVTRGAADGLIFDMPQLRNYLHENPSTPLVLVDTHRARQQYGFALQAGNPLRRKLDAALMTMTESGRMDTIVETWLGSE